MVCKVTSFLMILKNVKKMESIINELDNLFDTESYEDKGSHYIDPTGDSTYSRKSYFIIIMIELMLYVSI